MLWAHFSLGAAAPVEVLLLGAQNCSFPFAQEPLGAHNFSLLFAQEPPDKESFPHAIRDSSPRIWGSWEEPFGCHWSLFLVVQHMKDFMGGFGTTFLRLPSFAGDTFPVFCLSPGVTPPFPKSQQSGRAGEARVSHPARIPACWHSKLQLSTSRPFTKA